MESMKSSDGAYTICLERKNVSLWRTEMSYKYLCNIYFLDFLNRKVFTMTISEEDVLRLGEAIYNYLCMGMQDVEIRFSSISTNLNSYIFKISQSDISGDFIIVEQYNHFLNQKVNIIKIELQDIEGTEFSIINLLNLLYEEFLFDMFSFSYLYPDFSAE